MIKIKQKIYSDLEIDTSDKKIISIENYSDFDETERILIERENLPQLIEILQGEVNKNKS